MDYSDKCRNLRLDINTEVKGYFVAFYKIVAGDFFLLRNKMDPSVNLNNWRTAPYSLQSFHRVDQLIPVSLIKCNGSVWELPIDLQSIDSLVFEDPRGRERKLSEVLEATWTRGLVVLQLVDKPP